ncbi:MAG: FAD-dependent monooxygenase [Pseudomonadota bacterium]
MEFDADIIVVGGGLTGPALALASALAGASVIVLDAGPAPAADAPAFDGRSYAVALGSQNLLRALGVWEHVAPNAQPILDIVVSDGRAGQGVSPLFVHFDHREIEEGPFGALVEDRHLRVALHAAATRHAAVEIRHGARVRAQAVTQTGAEVSLEDGTTLHARVLVGCDGRQSGVAARAGIRRLGWDYDQTSLVCAIAHAKPHEGTAHQIFLPPGPLAILPLQGDQSAIVWTESRARAQAIMELGDADYIAELRPRFGDFLGEISLVGQRYAYPLGLTLAERFVAPRVALVGDAAHGIHPIAGQGLNLGFRDIAAFAEVISDGRRRGEDIGAAPVLARYQTWRRFDTSLLAVATDGFNRLFSNDHPLLRHVRDVGLGAVNRLPPLRRGFMR